MTWESARCSTFPLLRPRVRRLDKVREYGVPVTYDPETDECHFGSDPGYGGSHLTTDVEGLAMYHADEEEGYLLASSQGDSTYAVYEREPDNDVIGSFRVGAAGGIDPTRGTDGIEVLNVPMGRYAKGLFVAQDRHDEPDARDDNGRIREKANFTFVEWKEVAKSFSPRLPIDTDGWHPRD